MMVDPPYRSDVRRAHLRPAAVVWLERLSLLVAAILIGRWAYTGLAAHAYQQRAMRLLDSGVATTGLPPNEVEPVPQAGAKRESAAKPVEPGARADRTPARVERRVPAHASPGLASEGVMDVVGKLEIRRLGIAVAVAEGTGSDVLDRAVGHVPGTALPGRAGNVGLAGHRDSFFRNLEGVRRGDRIRFTTRQGTYVYEVIRTRVVDPDRIDVLAAEGDRRLTLVTCYPFSFIGPAPQRLVVTARAVGESSAGGAQPRRG